MFLRTNVDTAPWTIVKSDDKMRARINAMRHVLEVLDYAGKNQSVARPPDPWIVASAGEIYQAAVPIR